MIEKVKQQVYDLLNNDNSGHGIERFSIIFKIL